MSKIHRSAKNGQFVTPKFAKTHPATTLAETKGGKPTERERSAKSGQFVAGGTAARRPTTTVKEK
jgi:hypothetical protein